MLLPPVYEWKSAVLYWDQNLFRANKIIVIYSQDLLLMKAVHCTEADEKILPAVHCANSGNHFQKIGQFLKFSELIVLMLKINYAVNSQWQMEW